MSGLPSGTESSYWNAHLLQEGFCDQSERTLKIYTDVIQVSLRKLGVGPTRIQHLGVIVSVVSLGRTYYVLAAHPYFLPAELCPELSVLEEDREIPSQLLERKWEGVGTFLDDGPTITDDGEFVPQLADEGLKGHMVRPRFGAVAHFLVVQKMLSRFKRLCFYVDTASELNSSALVAMREGVRNKPGRGRFVSVLQELDGAAQAPAGKARGLSLPKLTGRASGTRLLRILRRAPTRCSKMIQL